MPGNAPTATPTRRHTLQICSLDVQKTLATAIEAVTSVLDATAPWDMLGLQEILTCDSDEQIITARAGHVVAIAPHRRGQHSTAMS